MVGALTAADEEDFVYDEEAQVTPTGYEVGVSEGMVADLTPAYDAAIQRLREQRRGLSARERLGALLVGLGQPTRSGRWQDQVANAGSLLFQQSLARRQEDEARRRELERLMNAREVAKIRSGAAVRAAEIRAKAAGTPGTIKPRVQVSPNPVTGEPMAFNIEPGPDGKPQVSRLTISGGTETVPIPEISEPEQGAQHPDSPVVKTPVGLLKNPFYKGG